MQFSERENNFLTSAFSSPCRVTKEAVSAFECKTQAAFFTEAFRVLWEESKFITCLILQFAWLSKHEIFHTAQSWVLFPQEGLLPQKLCPAHLLLLTEDALAMWPLYMRSGGKIKIYICKMYFMMEKKVEDYCGWEAFECHMLGAKAVLVASMQEAAKLLVTEEELNRCQTFITNLSTGKKSHVSWKARCFSLAK